MTTRQYNGIHAQAAIREKLTQDLAVHHHLPCIDRQIRIVKAPVKLLRRGRLIRRVVVRRQVLVRETVGGGDS